MCLKFKDKLLINSTVSLRMEFFEVTFGIYRLTVSEGKCWPNFWTYTILETYRNLSEEPGRKAVLGNKGHGVNFGNSDSVLKLQFP